MMKRITFLIPALALSLGLLASCGGKPFTNPGDFLGGGGTGEIADSAEDVTGGVKEDFSDGGFADLAGDTSSEGAVAAEPTEGVYSISESGSYLFRGDYGGIAVGAKNLKLHLIFDGAKITTAEGIALDGATNKGAEVVITLIGENSIVSTAEGENAVQIKGGSLSFNGDGALSVTSTGKNAIKVSKELTVVNCSLTLTAGSHAVSALSVSASDCTIDVPSAGKDGIHAECDDETTAFTTQEGYVYLKNVDYSCAVAGDGIQADTVVYLDGGTYDIKTAGEFVEDNAQNRAEYGLAADDFRYIKSGNGYQKVASDYMGRDTMYGLAQGCKGIKVGEIEYPDPSDSEKEIAVTEGDYSILIEGGTFTIDSTDDAIHANSGTLSVRGGTFTISTSDDALTSDVLTKISGGEITVTKSYEGIEGGYVEITGGTVQITAQDDGINAASNDMGITEHVIISGGKVYVDASGDGIDSNGTILISGGETYVAGPTSNMDCSIDSERGTVVTGGYLFAVGSLGMVETPAQNSTQNVVSFAQSRSIAAGTNLSLTDENGNALFTFQTPKACQSVILSCLELAQGKSYRIYGGDSNLCEFTVQGIITTVGSSGGIGRPGGSPGPGGPGGPGFAPRTTT